MNSTNMGTQHLRDPPTKTPSSTFLDQKHGHGLLEKMKPKKIAKQEGTAKTAHTEKTATTPMVGSKHMTVPVASQQDTQHSHTKTAHKEAPADSKHSKMKPKSVKSAISGTELEEEEENLSGDEETMNEIIAKMRLRLLQSDDAPQLIDLIQAEQANQDSDYGDGGRSRNAAISGKSGMFSRFSRYSAPTTSKTGYNLLPVWTSSLRCKYVFALVWILVWAIIGILAPIYIPAMFG